MTLPGRLPIGSGIFFELRKSVMRGGDTRGGGDLDAPNLVVTVL